MKTQKMKKQAVYIVFTVLYVIVLFLYLDMEWKYEMRVSSGQSSLLNRASVMLSFQDGLLKEFLILIGLRILGGVLLALPQACSVLYQAKCAGRVVRLRWGITTILILPLLVPVLGLAADFNFYPTWFFYLMNGFTRCFCAVFIGYLIVPKISQKDV